MKQRSDVIVVGGGAIGLSTAFELAQEGASVRLIDKGRCGREASWAGAGMIIPGNSLKARTPEARLRSLSYELWPDLTDRLRSLTDIDSEFRICGGLEVGFEKNGLDSDVQRWQDDAVEAALLSPNALAQLEPACSRELRSGYHLPAMAQVRNPRHLRALQAACASLGVQIEENTEVVGFSTTNGRVTEVQTSGGSFTSNSVCICSGAWTGQLLQRTRFTFPIQPVRGQMVMLKCNPLPFSRIIQMGPRYLVPRSDGRALIGSTEEWVGFQKRTTAGAVASLIGFATSVIPELADATIERTWAGLRPGSPDGVPFIGLVPGLENMFVAAGHFRNGLQNSPGTARFLRQLVLDQTPSLNPTSFVHTLVGLPTPEVSEVV